MKILFLCTGNMHRSPLAEAMLRAEIARDTRTDIEVTSAGILDTWSLPAVDEAVQLAAEAGLDLSNHRSRQATPGMLAEADQILVMEQEHLEWIEKQNPAAAAKSSLLSTYAGPDGLLTPGADVPDAIGEDLPSFRRTFSILSDCVGRFYRQLPPPHEEVYTRAIEERFRLRRRTPLTLSPADFELAGRWFQQGIPLWIVIESIDDLFRKKDHAGDPARVRRLAWCQRAVEARFEEYQRTHVTAGPAAPREQTFPVNAMLTRAAGRLRTAARVAQEKRLAESARVLARAADDIDAASSRDPLSSSATRLLLHNLEDRILADLRVSTDPVELTRLRERAATRLSGQRVRMTATAFEATLERLVNQGLRELYDLPELSSPV